LKARTHEFASLAAIPVPDIAVCLRRRFVQSNSAFRRDFVLDRNVAWNLGASSEPWRPECSRAYERNDGVDIRGRASDEPAVLPSVDPLRSSLVGYVDDRFGRNHSLQHGTSANQHSGRLCFAARVSWDVWQRRAGSVDADRGRLYRNGLRRCDIQRTSTALEILIKDRVDTIIGKWGMGYRRRICARTSDRRFQADPALSDRACSCEPGRPASEWWRAFRRRACRDH